MKYPYQDPTLDVETRVADLLSRMTLEEKIHPNAPVSVKKGICKHLSGNISALEANQHRLGALYSTISLPPENLRAIQDWILQNSRLGIPAAIHGETLHGFMHENATVFPQAIGLGATFNRELMTQVVTQIGKEARACGAHLTYAPNADLSRDPRWGRVEENYGEDPYLTSEMGVAYASTGRSGVQVVEYHYDAWGNLLSTTGDGKNGIGATNPLRYRGYVYDEETELYYLQSRYYDPEMGRFINADDYVSTGHGVLGNNMFAYCNNPVRGSDEDGKAPTVTVNADRVIIECEEAFGTPVGTVTVVASVEYEIVDGLLVDLGTFEIDVSSSGIEVSFPDGQTFYYTYDSYNFNPDSYAIHLLKLNNGSAIDSSVGLDIVYSKHGLGLYAMTEIGNVTYGIKAQYKPNFIGKVLNSLKIIPAGGGGFSVTYGGSGAPFGCGCYKLKNPTLMFM